MILRKCIKCGLEAKTEKDLSLFLSDKRYHYGKRNECKSCRSKHIRERHEEDDVFYLKNILQNMKNRCYNKNNSHYYLYGGRGIQVFDGWINDKNSFIGWALENGFKRGLTIDRIDNNKGYSPDNCRWVTQKQNCRNKNNNVTVFEENLRVCKICKKTKPLNHFHKTTDPSRCFHIYICKTCKSEYDKRKRKLIRNEKTKNNPLKKCVDCGLEIWNMSDLKKFVKCTGLKYDRRNICKTCNNIRQKKSRENSFMVHHPNST